MNTFETALLRYLKPEELAAIQAARIGIGGAGGLGSNVAVILARTGFKHFEIIDKDVVEPSNLNRQHYTLADIGKPKVDRLKAALLSINPDIKIITHQREWPSETAEGLFEDCAIMVEAFDKAACKHAFVDHYRKRAKYVVSGNGMAGLNIDTDIAIRKIGNLYLIGDGATDINDGHPPLAPRVMETAAKMAGLILKLTLAP
jgi:sulfur carrier protein ThiS adenylyltransferase